MASRRRPVTSAARAGRSASGQAPADRIGALLTGESLDTSRLSYDFDAHHIALVAAGSAGRREVEVRVRRMDRPHLLLEGKAGFFWGWVGQKEAFDPAQVETLASSGRRTSPNLRLAVGEPGQGLSGWRLTHHQARAALAVGVRGHLPVVRFADVALLATAIRDDLLATSLRSLYIEPLEQGRGDGKELRCTLRAYFAADRNASIAGDAIGVTRQAVARRLRAVEERLGRPIASCAPDLELALRLEALESAPTRLSVP